MYNNGFPLNSQSRWVPVGSVEGVGKAGGFFSLPVEGVEKNRWKKPLGFFLLPVESIKNSRWENLSYPLKDS